METKMLRSMALSVGQRPRKLKRASASWRRRCCADGLRLRKLKRASASWRRRCCVGRLESSRMDRPATKEVETRLNVMETKMLRSMAGVTRLDRIRNEAIRQKFGVAPIADKMREARLRW
ncbi:unnamed protein product [Heligmosomoides polygyrus]|uniref:39S ribosomal protein L52, mitochondrial n=1 Tax=Heligmosomoides polygyrus TaxID=6339 RepID=A0A183F577_HELPZ|nr:unnamed protein product [Heligmosomoides polygyrus]